MRRTNIYLAPEQIDRLRRLADAQGTAVAKLVREAVEEYLDRKNVRAVSEDEWRRRFGGLLARRGVVADRLGLTEDQVERDVAAAVRIVRKRRRANRR